MERLIAEKTARVPPSATSPATTRRRLLRRTPTADVTDSPVHRLRRTEEETRLCRELTGRSVRPGVRKPRRVYWSNMVRIGAGRATSRFEDGNDLDYRVTSTVKARLMGVIGPPGGRNRVTNRAPAITSMAALESPSSRGNSPSKTGDIQQASSSEPMTKALVYKHSWRGSKTTRSTSNGMR